MSLLSRERIEMVAGRVATAPAPDRGPRPAVLVLRLATCCALLVYLAFSQDPGKVSRDTKLDLVVDPVGFLHRALSLWDGSSAFGQLQNQAYGYLFPMGPFFAGTDLLGLSPWVAQRLWIGLLMTVAFLGVYLLAGMMGIGTPLTRAVAAFAFALTPRLATELGPISSEALPLCVSPWVLMPLVRGANRGSERRAAALSALAFACCGAVNAVATLAVLPLPAVYLLTRSPGPRRRRLIGWWLLAVGLVSLWWVIPLATLGAYSFPFLDYIETSDITTASTSLAEVLRGASHWLAGLVAEGAPWWRGGWLVETAPAIVLASCVVAGLGLAGAARRAVSERLFLVCSIVLGALLVTFGYHRAVGPLAAGTEAQLLDGVLAPFRNVHKFDVVLRLPLVLGLAGLLSSVRRPQVRPLVHLAAICAVGLTAMPFLSGSIEPSGSYRSVPAYWSQAAQWLGDNATGTALLLPAAGFGEYYWGSPMDDPLQPLARSPWAVRNQIPLSSEGNIRLLDAVQADLSDGQGDPGLAAALARAGVSHVVLRNDLDWARVGAPRPLLVHQALERSGGFTPVAAFGPGTAANRVGAQQVSEYGTDPLLPAVEVYAVSGGVGRIHTYPTSDVVSVVGGPDALVAASGAGLVTGRATVLDGDPEAVAVHPSSVLLSDAARARKLNFGAVYDNATATLGQQHPASSRRRTDFLPWDGMRRTVARFRGADVTASSSASETNAYVEHGPEYWPAAAVDGDLDSAWISGAEGGPLDQWIQLRWPSPREVGPARVSVLDTTILGARITALRVRTDAGTAVTRLQSGQSVQRLRMPQGRTRQVRVEVAGIVRTRAGAVAVGIRELLVGGVRPRLELDVPAARTDASTAGVLVSRARGARTGCVRTVAGTGCAPGLARLSEEDGDFRRRLLLPQGMTADVAGWVRPRAGAVLDEVVRRLTHSSRLVVETSSALVGEPSAGGQALRDGDPATSWVASHDDRDPTVVLRWRGTRTVDRMRILSSVSPMASKPTQVIVSGGGRTQKVALDDAGWARFAPVSVRRLTLRFPAPEPVFTAAAADHRQALLPVGLAEVQVPALLDLYGHWDRAEPVLLGCGRGPALVVDGRQVPTMVDGMLGQLLDRAPLELRACANVTVAAGRATVWAPDSWLPVESLAFMPVLAQAPDARQRPVRGEPVETSSQRRLRLGPGERTVLAMGENFNRGWAAELGGRRLHPVRVDGWQQGFVVPAGPAVVVWVTFTPDRPYRAGLALGLAAALIVPVLAVVRGSGVTRRGVDAARAAPSLVAGLAVVSLVLLGGVLGGVVAVLVLATVWAFPRIHAATVAVTLLSAVGVLGAFGVSGRGGFATTSSTAQLLVLAALAVVWSSLLPDRTTAEGR